MQKTAIQILIVLCLIINRDVYASGEGIVKGKIKVDGKQRTYELYIPKGYYTDDKNLPLLIAMHGRLGTGKQMMESSGFNEIADREKFIVVYPDGLDRSWADGRGETPSDKKNINDVKYISSLIDHLSEKYRVDTSKVFATGHSNGGAMTNRLGFDLSMKLAGIASVGANVSEEMVKKFSSEKHIPVLFINGTDDEFIPFEGGKGKMTGYIYPPVMDIFNKWLSFNQCNTPLIDTLDEIDDGTSVVFYTYNCGLAPVKMIKIINGGHSYPGGDEKLPEWLVGKYVKEINASEEIWKFFKQNIK